MPVARTGSVLSCSSIESSSVDSAESVSDVPTTPKSNKPAGEIPFVRRRLQHEQTVVLSALFQQQTHPSKDVRIALAEELCMCVPWCPAIDVHLIDCVPPTVS